MNHRYWIEVAGKGQWMTGQWIQGKLWIHAEGQTFVAETETKSYGKGKSTKAKADIHALMPGKVTKVLAVVGTAVTVGQVLVVMEAMKMEYSLKAETAGIVKKIHCQVGDQVPLGKILVSVAE